MFIQKVLHKSTVPCLELYLVIKPVSVHLDQLVDKGQLTECLLLFVQLPHVVLVGSQVALQDQ